MRKPIEIGTRVSAEYDSASGVKKVKGIFTGIDFQGYVVISDRDVLPASEYRCVPRSMRRLVKKKDLRRRFWVNIYEDSNHPRYLNCAYSAYTTKDQADSMLLPDKIECIEVVEVKKVQK